MSGGNVQIMTRGEQDVALTAMTPMTITYFQVDTVQHTVFACDYQQVTPSGTAQLNASVQLPFSRSGDLNSKGYVHFQLSGLRTNGTNLINYVRHVGNVAINRLLFNVGGTTIDTVYGLWMQLWADLTLSAEKLSYYDVMTGNVPLLFTPTGNVLASGDAIAAYNCDVPLDLWWARTYGQSFPLLGVQFHSVILQVDFRSVNDLVQVRSAAGLPAALNLGTNALAAGGNALSNANAIANMRLDCEYVHLDKQERNHFVNSTFTYLVVLHGFNGTTTINHTGGAAAATFNVALNLNHPCRNLIFTCRPQFNINQNTTAGAMVPGNEWTNYTDGSARAATVTGAPHATNVDGNLVGFQGNSLLLNAQVRFMNQDRTLNLAARYFQTIQPFQYHSGMSATGVNVYSFAIHPEIVQTSGTANFSRIDSAFINVQLVSQDNANPAVNINWGNVDIDVYTLNSNVFYVGGGVAGLHYAT
jgi:hypothetical protein